MPDIVHVTILNRLKTLIATDFSSGFSGLDLSDRVVIGAVLHSPQVPLSSLLPATRGLLQWPFASVVHVVVQQHHHSPS